MYLIKVCVSFEFVQAIIGHPGDPGSVKKQSHPNRFMTCIRCITCLLRNGYIDLQQIQLLKNKKNEKSNK